MRSASVPGSRSSGPARRLAASSPVMRSAVELKSVTFPSTLTAMTPLSIVFRIFSTYSLTRTTSAYSWAFVTAIAAWLASVERRSRSSLKYGSPDRLAPTSKKPVSWSSFTSGSARSALSVPSSSRAALVGGPALDEGLREGPTIAHAIAVPQVDAEEFGADSPADHVADVVEEGPEIEHCGHDAARLSDGPLVVVRPPVQVPIERVLNAALQGVE